MEWEISALTRYLHKVVIDEVNDLHVPGQDFLKHISVPTFQSLWENRVVRVSTAPRCDVPSLSKRLKL